MEHHRRIQLILLIGALVIGNVYFGLKYLQVAQELEAFRTSGVKEEFNHKVLDFTSMFVEKVLRADKEVDFETRLTLENAVRGLKDDEIMAEWQRFVGSKTELEAQESVKKLLGLLISKIRE